MTTIGWIVSVAAFVVAAVIFFLLGIRYRKNVAEREISSAEEEATRIINEAIKSSENKKREALLEAKEEILKSRKFWSAIVGIAFLFLNQYVPDFPFPEDYVLEFVIVIAGYILGVGIEGSRRAAG